MAGLLDKVQEALTGGVKAVGGLASGINALMASKNNSGNPVYASLGIAGSAGKQYVTNRGNAQPAKIRGSLRAKNDNQQTTESLLTDIVRYLVSINNTLKKQIDFDKMMYNENALAEREAKIEKNSAFDDLGKRYGAANDNQKKGNQGIIGAILSALGALKKLALGVLIKGLAVAIKSFKTAWSWLRGLSFLKNVKNLLGLTKLIVGFLLSPAGLAILTTLALGLGIDRFIKDANRRAQEPLDELEKKYGMKRVPGGWVLPDGKTYKDSELPEKYRDVKEAYGPNNRGAKSDAARERIAKNPGAYDPDVMARELKGGKPIAKPAPAASQPTPAASQPTPAASQPTDRISPDMLGKTPEQLTDAELRKLVEAQRRIEDPRGVTNNPGGILYKTGPLQEYQVGYVLSTKDKSVRVAKYDTLEHGVQAAIQNWRTSRYAGKPIRDSLDMWSGGDGAKYESWLTGRPAQPSSSSGSSDGLLQKARDAIDGALTNIAEFIGAVGGVAVGPGAVRGLTTPGPDFAKMISDESTRLQNEIAMGEKKSQMAIDSVPSAEALRAASPTGSISVVDPNYSGKGKIEKYLAHYKFKLAY